MAKRAAAILGRPAYRRDALSSPRSDVFLPPVRQLPTRTSPVAGPSHRPTWLFTAAHGGSGATLLSRLSWHPYDAAVKAGREVGEEVSEFPAYGMNAGRAWPDPQLEPTGLVIVVCQTTLRGLAWARDAAAQYLSGRAPEGLHLVGVVTIADQPGRLPRPIAATKGLLAGVYPHTWHVPYIPEYRLLAGLPNEDCPPMHPAVEDVLAAIRSTVTPRGHLA